MSALDVKNGTTAPAETRERVATATPRVDVFETENEFLVLADLPGVTPGDVDIRFEKGELSIHGTRPAPARGTEPALREYEAVNYHRGFVVADSIAADKISAELKNGVLTVKLPKVEAVKPKRIAVRG